MKHTSNAYATIAESNSARYYAKIEVDGATIQQEINNFKLVGYENPDNDISIGNTCSASISFSIYSPTVSLENKEITVSQGLMINNAIEYVKLGIFKITKQTSDAGREYTNYEGYDRMYSKFEMPYFSELTYPTTDLAMQQEICTKLGIHFIHDTLTAHTINEKKDGYTYREMTGYLAALNGKNAVINADGNLEYRWYDTQNYTIGSSKYYMDDGAMLDTSKNFIIQRLTCYTGTTTATTSLTVGNGATGLTFTDPLMTQDILNEVYNKVKNFTFQPMTVKFVGDFRLEVGDIVSITKGNKTFALPVMQITHECDGGLITTIKSIGKSDTSNANAQGGPITKQMQRYYTDLLLVNQAMINKLDVETANITYATIIDLNAVTARVGTLEATQLTADYANLHYAKIDLTNIADGSIKRAMIDTGAIGTAQIADASITDGKIVGLTASKLTAGTIDAADINVVNLNCANLTVGQINGNQIAQGAVDSSKLDSLLTDTITGTKNDLDNLAIGGENILTSSKTLMDYKYYIITDILLDENGSTLLDENEMFLFE